MNQLSDDQIILPELLPVPDGALVFWVIWDHPKDFPNGYVLRPQIVVPGSGNRFTTSVAWYASDPDKLRAILPPGCIPFARSDQDPPYLLETWMA
jgi:hypothetical protein